MRDQFRRRKPLERECGVMNLHTSDEPGSHWTAYCKEGQVALYFDSFGNLRPPEELLKYLGSDVIVYYNHKKCQSYGTVNCGHLCLEFLYNFYNKK